MSQVPPSPSQRSRSVAIVLCALLVGLFAFLSYSAALRKSATYDEPLHALGGWLKLHRGDLRMDYESLPLATMWAGFANRGDAIHFNPDDENWVELPNDPYRGFALASGVLFHTRGNDGAAFINRSRFMMMLLGAGLAALVIAWAWKLNGPMAAVIAGALFCLDPNMIGHASLVKTDIAVSLAMAGTLWAACSTGRKLTPLNVSLFLIALALAMNTKFSAMLLWPMLALLAMVRIIDPSPWQSVNRSYIHLRERLLIAAAIGVSAIAISVLSIWATHNFRFGPSSNPAIQLSTDSYRNELILHEYFATHPAELPPFSEDAGVAQMLSWLKESAERIDASSKKAEAMLAGAHLSNETRGRLRGFIDRAAAYRNETVNVMAQVQQPPVQIKPEEIRAALYDSALAMGEASRQLNFVDDYVNHPHEPHQWVVRLGTLLLNHHWMPAAWTNGLLVQFSRAQILDSYLLGQVRGGGAWYFFPLAMLVKTPIASLVALALAGVLGIRRMKRKWRFVADWYWPAVCLLMPVMIFLGAAMMSNLNIGLRHIFPIYPLLFVAAGVLLADEMEVDSTIRRAVSVLAVLLVIESLSVWPNDLAYFNFAVGGSRGGLKLLGDSNLDWGQDLPGLLAWQKKHPDVPLSLAYFGTVDPAFYGIQYEPLSPWPPPLEVSSTHAMAVSATHLQGIFDKGFAGYQMLTPSEVIGGTIYVYDLRSGR